MHMNKIGTLESVWRYPVKSMRGESVEDVFVAYTGVMGDRLYAISSSDAPAEFPWHTNREQEEFILYSARYRNQQGQLRMADASVSALRCKIRNDRPASS